MRHYMIKKPRIEKRKEKNRVQQSQKNTDKEGSLRCDRKNKQKQKDKKRKQTNR